MKNWLTRIPLFSFLYFVFLFDEDGAQLGTALFDNVPAGIITTASIFGNIFWLFGGVMLLVGIIMIIMSLDESKTRSTVKEFTPEKREEMFKKNPVAQTIGFITTLFAIGSGFWFYGLGALVVTIAWYVWLGELKQMADKIDEENGVEKPFSALDLAKTSLLDD